MNVPTEKQIEAFYTAHDASLECQPREHNQAVYEGLSAALAVDADAVIEAASLAAMITEWVDGGIKGGTDWRPGLEGIISKRLLRLRALSLPPSADKGGLSEWSGWDRSNLPWSEVKHKDAVCYAAFGQTWSMEDAEVLISFIDRTWSSTADGGAA